MNKVEQVFAWLALHPEWIAGALVLSMATLIVVGLIDNAKPRNRYR